MSPSGRAAKQDPSPKPKPKRARKPPPDIRDMVRFALEAQGGTAYQRRQAENPTAFLGLVARLMPTTILGQNGAPLVPKTITLDIVEQGGSDA